MEDDDSTAANVGTASAPSQIHQLATVLWNILNNDRESNAAILEKLENPGDDLSTNPVQVFTAADLAHLASPDNASLSPTGTGHGRIVRNR